MLQINKNSLLSAAIALLMVLPSYHTYANLPFSVNGKELPSLAPMLEKVTPAVVSISVEGTQAKPQRRLPKEFEFFFGPTPPSGGERPFKGLGSGVIIDADKAYVVTNNHVIDNANSIKVQLHDGREYEAILIGSDAMSDIALLQLKDSKNLTEIKLTNSDALRVGDFTVAIGNPFGLGQTATSGIVSALGRSGLNIENFENFIQTDAAINSGNSGGALVNLKGELIGINTAILGPNGGNIGIGFAIPSNMVKSLTEQILQHGEVRRGQLGVRGGEITSELAEALGYNSSNGAFIQQVMPDSPAEKAGLMAGDIVIKIDGKTIKSFSELRAKVATLGAGKKVKMTVIRDGKTKHFTVTLGEASQTLAKAQDLHSGLSGATLANTDNNDPVQGVKVTKVEKGSMADQYQLKEGDIILALNRQPIRNLAELRKALDKKPNILALNIQRQQRQLYLVIR